LNFATQIDSIIVAWTSGKQTKYFDLDLNKRIQLVEDGTFNYQSAKPDFQIISERTPECPNNIVRLYTNEKISEVSWYKNGDFVLTGQVIPVPLEMGENLYEAVDNCGNTDSILIINTAISSQMFPNPARDFVQLTITNNAEAETSLVEIYDVAGRWLQTYRLPLEQGFTTHELPLTNFVGGTYFVKIQSDCWETVEKLVVVPKD